MACDAGEHSGKPSLRIDVVHFRRDDEAVHGGGAISAAIGAGEEPRLPSECDTAQAALGGIVRKTDAAVIEEACEGGPALEHVIHGLGEIAAARELRALGTHASFQLVD